MTASTAIYFSHPNSYVGDLVIENGIDNAQWSYGLNTQVYPTYGGEVVQILSVYIDDMTLQGSIATYRQAELIYTYFSRYMEIATQGTTATPSVTSGDAYSLVPMRVSYPMRGWTGDDGLGIQIYPKAAPGFAYDLEMTNPTWTMTAHIIDTTNTLTSLKQAIQNGATTQASYANAGVKQGAPVNGGAADNTFANLSDDISPNSGDPNTDPFQTFDEGAEEAKQAVGGLADYYASLVDAYANHNYQAITGGVGSKPAKSSGKNAKKSKGKTKTKGKTRTKTPTGPGDVHRAPQ